MANLLSVLEHRLLKDSRSLQDIIDSLSLQDMSQVEHNHIVIQVSLICSASSIIDRLSLAKETGVRRLQEAYGILIWDLWMRSLLLDISPMKW